ncbi:hypothetical protein LAT59_04510 [Candidatus Gracilibacteria bacterium]|nr:hypothetical protein [Candidatus Gracilibacteria bacterium]
MKKKNNLTVKIMASLALGAIVLSVIGTGLIFLYEIYFNTPSQVNDLSPEELERLIQELRLEQEDTGEDMSIIDESSREDEYEENVLQ